MKQIIFNPTQDPAFNQYLNSIRHYPVLKDQQIRQLVEDFHTNHQSSIRNQVVCANLRYVVTIAKQMLCKIPPKRFRNRIELLDLIEAGNQGLIHAVYTFNPSLAITFVSYATYWIKRYIGEYLSRKVDTVKQPSRPEPKTDYDAIYVLGQPASYYEDDDHTPNCRFSVHSIDSLTHPDSDESLSLADTLASEDDMFDKLYRGEQSRNIVLDALKKLPKQEATVICLSYGIDCEPINDHEIASMLQLASSERVRQIREHAQRKLANYIDPQSLV